MAVKPLREVEVLARGFAVPGELVAVDPLLEGHIHDSFRLCFRDGDTRHRFLLQRVNDRVFRDPPLLMENIDRVTRHLRRTLEARGVADAGRRALRLVPTCEGAPYRQDAQADYWRLYHFIEGVRSVERVETPSQAFEAGRAFGAFQALLANYDGPRLHPTIPDFHHTPLRLDALERAVREDRCGRRAGVLPEIEACLAHRGQAGALVDLQLRGELPERIAHNDAKIGNVLFDEATGEGLCVVDLDTVMPGSFLHDFGDMMRSMVGTAPEDECDLSRVRVERPLFASLARGYLEAAGEALTPAERENMVLAGQVITLEQAVRFLTDHLDGDRYYRTHRPDHNLDRCRSQLKLLEEIRAADPDLRRILAEV